METIRLEFQPKIKAKILELLSSFSSDELKIVQVEEDAYFEENKRKAHADYEKMKSGTAKFYTVEEVDAFLDETFSEYDS